MKRKHRKSRPTPAKSTTRPTTPTTDLGPRERRQHADIEIDLIPTTGRRARCVGQHERLWRAGTISGAEFEAVQSYIRCDEIAAGARESRDMLVRRDHATWSGYPDAVVEAVAWLRRAREGLAPVEVMLIEGGCCKGDSVSALARRLLGVDHGAARAAIVATLVGACQALGALTARPAAVRCGSRARR